MQEALIAIVCSMNSTRKKEKKGGREEGRTGRDRKRGRERKRERKKENEPQALPFYLNIPNTFQFPEFNSSRS